MEDILLVCARAVLKVGLAGREHGAYGHAEAEYEITAGRLVILQQGFQAHSFAID